MIVGALLAVACATPASADAAAVQRTDPDASSPAGVIYQIPFDAGRRDGAPHRRGPGTSGSASGGSGGNAGSTLATGVAGAGAGGSNGSGGSGGSDPSGGAASSSSLGGTASASTGATPGNAAPDNPSSIHSENGFGSSSIVPGTPGASVDAIVARAARDGDVSGSATGTYLLLLLTAAVSLYVGFSAARARRT